jgi:uncharacterized repeat protein (TIGR03803 family)
VIVVAITFAVFGEPCVAADQILQSFVLKTTGSGSGPLTFDAAGNIYGANDGGGKREGGTAYQLSPLPGGNWKLTVLHTFAKFRVDGKVPIGNLVLDSKGNLYGVTLGGGRWNHGTVYELSPNNGGWKYSILHSFTRDSSDGRYPAGPVVIDPAGNIYGVTINGGNLEHGTVFELSPQTDGTWKESIIYEFSGDLTAPVWLLRANDGTLYGSVASTNSDSVGAIFQLTPSGGDSWTETTIYNFSATSLGNASGLVFDQAGNIFGIEQLQPQGDVFEVPHNADGSWGPEIVVFTFTGDIYYPSNAPLVLDADGNIYGTIQSGGQYKTQKRPGGILYKLSPVGDGTWKDTIVHNFGGPGDGAVPIPGPVLGSDGNLYGTTAIGGKFFSGVAWKITP